MNYHSNMYGVFAYISHLAEDETLTSDVKRDLIKAAGKIFDQNPMEALSDLTKARAMSMIADRDSTPYVNSSEAVAMAIISHSQTLEEVAMVRAKLGPFARKPGFYVALLAREAGLKEMIGISKEK